MKPHGRRNKNRELISVVNRILSVVFFFSSFLGNEDKWHNWITFLCEGILEKFVLTVYSRFKTANCIESYRKRIDCTKTKKYD